jgi:hypothetical protein
MAQSAKIQALAVELTAERDALQLEVERLGRLSAGAGARAERLADQLRAAEAEITP